MRHAPYNGGMILKERQDGVLVLTLNRPEKLNAITGELLDALYAALKEGEAPS